MSNANSSESSSESIDEIEESKYWGNVQLFEEGKLIMETPAEKFELLPGHRSKVLQCNELTDKEIDFLNGEDSSLTNLITTISAVELRQLEKLLTVFAACYNEKDEIVSIVQSTPVPFSIGSKTVSKELAERSRSGKFGRFLIGSPAKTNLAGITSRLSVREDFRGNGYCMNPILELIHYGFEHGVYYGYHVTDNTLHLYTNVFVDIGMKILDFDRCTKLGFTIPVLNENNPKYNRLLFRLLPSKKLFLKVSSKRDLNVTLNYLNTRKTNAMFKFQPNIDYWTIFCDLFDVYYSVDGSAITDLYVLRRSTVVDGDNKYQISYLALATSSGCLRSAAEKALESGSVALYIYELGELKLKSGLREEEKIFITDQTQKLSFYNIGVPALSKDIFLPIF